MIINFYLFSYCSSIILARALEGKFMVSTKHSITVSAVIQIWFEVEMVVIDIWQARRVYYMVPAFHADLKRLTVLAFTLSNIPLIAIEMKPSSTEVNCERLVTRA